MGDAGSSIDAFEVERAGAKLGLNPMFGDWQVDFRFPPIPYGSAGSRLQAFREKMQACLKTHFLYSSDVRLEITLHIDTQAVLETDERADLDNYAKAILDGLKGPKGLLLDDTQVQTLIVSRLDSAGRQSEFFRVSLSASPDDFIMKPVEFYEMPDGLWYPVCEVLWSEGRLIHQTELDRYAALTIHEHMASQERSVRHAARQGGESPTRAYQTGRWFSSSARGFHKSRIERDFVLHERGAWQAELAAWKFQNRSRIESIEAGFDQLRASVADLAKAFSQR